MHDRHDVTDEQWGSLEPFLPDRTPVRGGQWKGHRQVINGVMWRTRAGAPWRDLPLPYGNWKTVYNRHRRWSADGTWEKILGGLRVGCDVAEGAECELSVDATVVRAHHHAASARHDPPKDVSAERLAPTVLEESVKSGRHTGGTGE